MGSFLAGQIVTRKQVGCYRYCLSRPIRFPGPRAGEAPEDSRKTQISSETSSRKCLLYIEACFSCPVPTEVLKDSPAEKAALEGMVVLGSGLPQERAEVLPELRVWPCRSNGKIGYLVLLEGWLPHTPSQWCSHFLLQQDPFSNEILLRRQGFVIIFLFHMFKFLIFYRKSVNEIAMMNRNLGNGEL